MNAFCPSCDKTVEVADLTERCPQCHRAVVGGPSTEPNGPRSGRKGLLLGAAAVVLAVGGGAAWWFAGGGKTAASDAKATPAAASGESMAARLQKAGLAGSSAIPPGTADDAMKKAAAAQKEGAALAEYVKTLLGPGKLQVQPTTQRRGHPALNTASLFAEVEAGKAQPVHPVEAAFLVAGLAQASGQAVTFLTDGGGIQTPLLLSKTRVAVKLADGTVIEPFGTAAMQKPQTISLEQATAWWLVLRAHSQRMTFDFKAANADLAAAEAIWPKQAIVEFAHGVTQLDQGLVDQGLPSCESALAHQDDPLARLSLVQMALQLDQPLKAWTLAEQVVKAHPELPEAHLAVGVLNLQRSVTAPDDQKAGLMAEAKKELEKAKELDPKTVGVNAALAQLLMQQKDMAGAEKMLMAAAAQKDPDAALLLAEVQRSQGKSEEALKTLLASGLSLDDERVAVAMAQNQMMLKKTDEAMKTVLTALNANPSSRQLMMMRAELLRTTGKLQEAAEALQPLTESGPDADRAKLLQAQLYLQNRNVAKSLAILEPAQKAKPTDRETNMLLLIAYAVGEQPDKAEAFAKTAMEQKVLQVMDVTGVWLQAQQPDRAQKLLESQIAAVPVPDTEQVTLLAMLLTASGKKDEAIKLRDATAKKAGEKGAEVKEAVDKGVAAAEAEMARAKAAPAPDAPEPAGAAL